MDIFVDMCPPPQKKKSKISISLLGGCHKLIGCFKQNFLILSNIKIFKLFKILSLSCTSKSVVKNCGSILIIVNVNT